MSENETPGVVAQATAGTRTVPAAALRMTAGTFELGDNGADAKTAPIKMVARTGQPMEHWYWGRVVHDLSGMTIHKPRLPIDYIHDPDQILGYLNHFSTETGDLVASGALVPYKDSDRATEVIFKARAGVPYEASIFFGGDGLVIEEVPSRKSVEVNGYTLDGPAVVIRQWPLRGVAVCPYGADMNTKSEMKMDGGKEYTVTVLNPEPKETEMSASEIKAVEVAPVAAVEADPNAAAAAPAAAVPAEPVAPAADVDAEKKAAEAAAAAAAVDAEPPEAVAAAEPAKPEGQKFLDAFGDQGGVWFAQGKTFAEAQELHVAALKDRAEKAEAKAAALAGGEAEPVKFQADGVKPEASADLANKIGDNLAKVAAGLKFVEPKK